MAGGAGLNFAFPRHGNFVVWIPPDPELWVTSRRLHSPRLPARLSRWLCFQLSAYPAPVNRD